MTANGDSAERPTLGEAVRGIRRLEEAIAALVSKVDGLDFVRNDVYQADKKTAEAERGALIDRVSTLEGKSGWRTAAMFGLLCGVLVAVIGVLAVGIRP